MQTNSVFQTTVTSSFSFCQYSLTEVTNSIKVSIADARELVVIDAGVDDYQQLLQGIKPGIYGMVLNPDRDGVQQITQILRNYRGIETLHILSHGSPGCLHLGNTQLSLETLDKYTEELQQWFIEVPSPNLFIYGCEVAAGNTGTEFLAKVRGLTKANIAASANLTGNAALGGDWELEISLGEGQFVPAFTSESLVNYASVLDTGDSIVSGLPLFAQEWIDKNNPVPNVSITEGNNQITASYDGTLDLTANINEILAKLNLTPITQQITATNPTLVVQGTAQNPTGYEFSVSGVPVGEIMNGLGQLSNSAGLFNGVSSTGNVDLVLSDKGVKVNYAQPVELSINDIIDIGDAVDSNSQIAFVQKAIENIEKSLGDETKITLENSSLEVTQDGETEIRLESTINEELVIIHYRTPTNLSFSLPGFDGLDLSNLLSSFSLNIPGIDLPELGSFDWPSLNLEGLDFELSFLDGIPNFNFTLPNLPIANLKSLFDGFGLSLPSLDFLFELPNLPNLSLSIGTDFFRIEGLNLNFGDFLQGFGVDLPGLPDFNFEMPSLDIAFVNGIPTIEFPSLPTDFISGLLPTIDADFQFAKDLLNPIINEAKKFKVEPKKDEIKITYLETIDIGNIVETVASEAGLTIDLEKLTVKNPGLRIKKQEDGQRLYEVNIGEFSPTEAVNFLTGEAGLKLPDIIQNELDKVGNVSLSASKQGFGLTYLDNITLDVNNLIDSDGLLKDAANTITEVLLGDGDENKEGTQLVLAKPEVEYTNKDNNKTLSLASSFNGASFNLSFDVDNVSSSQIPKLSDLKFELPEFDATKLTNAFKEIAGTELPEFAKELITALGGLASLDIEFNDNGFGVTYPGELNISSTINSLLSTLGLGDNVLSDLNVTKPGLRVTTDDTGKKIYEASVGEFSPTEAVEFLSDTLGVQLPDSIQGQLNKVGKVNITASNQGFGITYLDDVTLDVNNIVGSITDSDFIKDAANTVTEVLLGDGDADTEGTQLVLAKPGIEYETTNNTKELSFAGDFNGEKIDFSFDISDVQNTIPKLSGLKFGLPELDGAKLTNAFQEIAGTELPEFAKELITALGSLANFNVELNDDGLTVTYLDNLNISSTINSLLSSLGLGDNVISQPLTVSNPGLGITKDEAGNQNYELFVSEFSPNQLIDLFDGLLPGVTLPSDISNKIKSFGNASLSLSSQGISVTYLEDVTFDLNGLIGDSFSSLSFIDDAVNKIAEVVLGDADNNKDGTQLVLAKPQLELKNDSLGIGGLLNEKEFDINFKEGVEFEYDLDSLKLNSILGDIPVLGEFQLDETNLSFADEFKLEGQVNFANNNDDISKFINEYLGVDNVGVALEIGKNDISLDGNLAGNIPLISIGGFKATLDNAALGFEMDATDANLGIDGSITLEGYDPIQNNEPPLTLSGGLKIEPESLTGIFNIDADGVWKNPFGLPNSELRELGVQVGATYIAPYIDNVGFVGDLKFGNYDFDSAFLVDLTDPQKFAIELTLNEELGLVDIITGPIYSYLLNASADLPVIDAAGELFQSLSSLVPISVVSIDGPDKDNLPDPLIKIVPADTKVVERTLEQGIAFNAGVKVGGTEGTLNFEMNPFSASGSFLEGSLKIPEIDILGLGIVKISGVDNGQDTDLNLDLKISPSEAYFRGDGQLELFGLNIARADFDISTSGIKVDELSLLGGLLKLSDVEIGESNGGIKAGGKLGFLGQSLEAEITGDRDGFELKTGLTLNLPILPDLHANLTIGSDGTFAGSKVKVDTSLGGFELSLSALNSIDDLVDAAIDKLGLGGVVEAFSDGIEFAGKALNSVVDLGKDAFNAVGGAFDSAVNVVGNAFNKVGEVLSDVGEFTTNALKNIAGFGASALNEFADFADDLELEVLGIDIGGAFGDFTASVARGISGALSLVGGLFGEGGNKPILGTNNNDNISGTNRNDTIFGGNGNDTIGGGKGADRLHGQQGNDQLAGGQGHDNLQGWSGDDSLDGGEGNDTLYGQEGNDLLAGGQGNDNLQGLTGNDSLNGGDGQDLLYGEQGNDLLAGAKDSDTLYGQDGDDTLDGGEGNDILHGHNGNDLLAGGEGHDNLQGLTGNDSLDGGEGNDILHGQQGNDL
ncbi:DUF4347 domain-containing protein, partial [Dapis sp. BLCC M126]|uniref:DUF4347 domain-containing protein n=1 Tax=Dapis sp. BLCC M126 TaxID=3400189 RepID=UPI003CEBDCDB